jgi:hypothetical protein
MIGAVARTALRETPEFADAKRRLQKNMRKQTWITKNWKTIQFLMKKPVKQQRYTYYW